jgi:hypothetical protein
VDHPQLDVFLQSVSGPRQESKKTYPDMIILSSCGKPVRLSGKLLVLSWAGFLERDGLEITSRNGFAVMPANLQCTNTHILTRFWRQRECKHPREPLPNELVCSRLVTLLYCKYLRVGTYFTFQDIGPLRSSSTR